MNHYLAAYTRNNSKWIKDFNARIETIKFLKQNIGSNFFNIQFWQ